MKEERVKTGGGLAAGPTDMQDFKTFRLKPDFNV